MFTGIVDHCGEIVELSPVEKGRRVRLKSTFSDLKEGESIATDGICLTVINPSEGEFSFELSPETLNCTTAKMWKVGKKINLERALRLNDRLGGHFVMGHVDQVVKLVSTDSQGDFSQYNFEGCDSQSMGWVVPKGCISINGVSVTINGIRKDGFEVMLIPHTLERTNLSELKTGSTVNVEYDYIARVIKNAAR